MKINGIQNPALSQALSKAQGKPTEDFGDMLMDVLKEVNASQNESRNLANSFLTGQSGVEIHDVKMAAEKAGVAMQLTIQVRNKVLEAYQEISRMQV
jgi:flagellar hook-basal body complex protein FliE